jgi:hypothetical protein
MAGAVIRPTMTRVAQAAVPGGVHARAGDGAASRNVMSSRCRRQSNLKSQQIDCFGANGFASQ